MSGPMNQPLIIRADASTQIGTGHVMRCLALAHAYRERERRAIFVTACNSDGLRRRLLDETFQVIDLERQYPETTDWETTSKVLAVHPDAWVVLDGYGFDPAYQCLIKETGHRLLVIDDTAHLNRYYADVLLNQNINAERLSYRCDPGTTLLLGVHYALLGPGFLYWRNWKREISEIARRVLVTFGGCDPDNVTIKAIRALQQLDAPDMEVRVVVGPSNLHLKALRHVVQPSSRSFQLLTDVNNMPELMAWADVAVSGGGSTCWELAFMGLPALVLVLAQNQQEIATALLINSFRVLVTSVARH